MLNKLVQFFQAPIFPNDSEKTHSAKLLTSVTGAIMIFVFFSVVGSLAGGNVPLLTILLSIVLFILNLGNFILVRRGKVKFVGRTMLAEGFLLITAAIASVGTIRAPVTSAYIFLIIIAGALFNKRGIWVTSLASSLAVLVLIGAEWLNLLPSADLSNTITQWITYTILFGLTGSISILANEITINALRRAEKEIAEHKQASILQEVVYKIAEAALNNSSLHDLYARIHEHISSVMDANNFHIVLFDEIIKLHSYTYWVDEKDNISRSYYLVFARGLTEKVLQTSKSLLYRQSIKDINTQELNENLPKVWLGTPLIVKGKTIGVMAVQNYNNPEAYTSREQRILEYVSTQVALAIDRKKVEMEVRLIEKRNSALIQNASDGIALINNEQLIKFGSLSAYRILDYEPGELIGSNAIDLVHPDDRKHLKLILKEIMEKPAELITTEYRLLHKSGDYIWIQGTYNNQFAEPAVNALVLNFRNITEQRWIEAENRRNEEKYRLLSEVLENKVTERTLELKEANEALEKASRLKDEFMASMSHELRTPLTSILGLSEVLQLETYGKLSEKQARALANIENSGRHLLDLINDILDLSKIEAGELKLQFDDFSVNDICQSSLQLTKGMAQKKQVKVSFSIDLASTTIHADSRRLKQILVNLLSNAIKFTPTGGAIGLEVDEHTGEGIVNLTVWDSGIGISSDDLKRLFRPFVQLDSSLSRLHTGTGLGLSLVSRLAELHGGSIRVDSTPGAGSRFTVSIPSGITQFTRPTQASPTVENKQVPIRHENPNTDQPGITVVLADDNEVILENITDFLQAFGHHVIKARNGSELLEQVLHTQTNIILTDIQMPGMDGLQAIKAIRSIPDPKINALPIIAITALAMRGDEEKCLQAGANLYISKPIQMSKLISQIEQLMSPHPILEKQP